jgi:hypothetical protein
MLIIIIVIIMKTLLEFYVSSDINLLKLLDSIPRCSFMLVDTTAVLTTKAHVVLSFDSQENYPRHANYSR